MVQYGTSRVRDYEYSRRAQYRTVEPVLYPVPRGVVGVVVMDGHMRQVICSYWPDSRQSEVSTRRTGIQNRSHSLKLRETLGRRGHRPGQRRCIFSLQARAHCGGTLCSWIDGTAVPVLLFPTGPVVSLQTVINLESSVKKRDHLMSNCLGCLLTGNVSTRFVV